MGTHLNSIASNTLLVTSAIDLRDNIILTYGDDADIAMVLNSAGVAADTILTGVIEAGTNARRMATAADSLLISNITNDGDMQFLVSDGGNSWGMLTFNADDHSAHFGQDDYGVDVKFYGETANDSLLWDASGNALIITKTNPTAAVHNIYSEVTSGGATGWTGSVSAIRGRQYITNTGTNIGNAYGGWFGVAFNTGMTASPAGLTCGVYAEAHSEVAYTSPSSVAFFQSVSSAAGNQTSMPILVLTSIGGTNSDKPKYAIHFGYTPAATTVRTGSGGMYHQDALMIKVNADDRWIPLSTVEGTFTTAYLIASTNIMTTTITGGATGKIGNTVSTTQAVAHTGWALGYFGTTTLSATTGLAYNAAGGVFEVNMASTFAATHAGIIVGLYVGAYANAAGRSPNAALYIEAIAGSGASEADMPLIALITSGAGTMSNVAIEFGHAGTNKAVTTGSGGMYHNETIQVKVNTAARYIPLSTEQTYFASVYPIAIADTRTLGGDAGCYRSIHAASAIQMEAGDHFGGVSCYLTLASGTSGTWAGAIVGTIDQSEPKSVTGYMAAGIFEAKNTALNCDTASAINLVWKNSAATGFGGVAHSFIRCDDTSPSDRRVQCLFELHNIDANVGVSDSVIACQIGSSTTPTHAIKFSANGVPYWIMVNSTAPTA